MKFIDTIFSMYTTAYFQMFGDFSLDTLQGEGGLLDAQTDVKFRKWKENLKIHSLFVRLNSSFLVPMHHKSDLKRFRL